MNTYKRKGRITQNIKHGGPKKIGGYTKASSIRNVFMRIELNLALLEERLKRDVRQHTCSDRKQYQEDQELLINLCLNN